MIYIFIIFLYKSKMNNLEKYKKEKSLNVQFIISASVGEKRKEFLEKNKISPTVLICAIIDELMDKNKTVDDSGINS